MHMVGNTSQGVQIQAPWVSSLAYEVNTSLAYEVSIPSIRMGGYCARPPRDSPNATQGEQIQPARHTGRIREEGGGGKEGGSRKEEGGGRKEERDTVLFKRGPNHRRV